MIQSIGTTEDNAQFGDAAALLGHLITLDGDNGYTDMTDPVAYEAANNPDSSKVLIVSDGLITPGGLAIGPDGSIYVSNFGIFSGAGTLVKINY